MEPTREGLKRIVVVVVVVVRSSSSTERHRGAYAATQRPLNRLLRPRETGRSHRPTHQTPPRWPEGGGLAGRGCGRAAARATVPRGAVDALGAACMLVADDDDDDDDDDKDDETKATRTSASSSNNLSSAGFSRVGTWRLRGCRRSWRLVRTGLEHGRWPSAGRGAATATAAAAAASSATGAPATAAAATPCASPGPRRQRRQRRRPPRGWARVTTCRRPTGHRHHGHEQRQPQRQQPQRQLPRYSAAAGAAPAPAVPAAPRPRRAARRRDLQRAAQGLAGPRGGLDAGGASRAQRQEQHGGRR